MSLATVHDARSYLTSDQVALLLKPVHPQRVLDRDGMSYVEGYDIKAELNRVFGFARWSAEILDQGLICEEQVTMRNKRDGWYVVYRTSLRLTVCAPDGTSLCRYEESHVGESTHPVRGEAHGNALTNSWTYALKRCATNLGDQFGLSLYNKGSREPIVRWTLLSPAAGAADTDDVAAVSPEEPENPGGEEAAVSQGVPVKRTRVRPAPEQAADDDGPLARIIALALGASTVEELRALFKKAGADGVLKTAVPGEGILVEDFLIRRNEQIRAADENAGFRGGAGSTEGAAAPELAGQR